MLKGIYHVHFAANNNNFGEGLVVVDEGHVNGGDYGYLYQGRFDYYGNDIKATIEVKHYNGPPNSVIGPLKEFTLNLSGETTGDRFEIAGGIMNIPNMSIKISGKKVADLFE
ncbi:MAG: hypothetical protein FVQ84_20890 [Planctomycetes bacterium]|nr:hypothetical protein [Planctomycetota bacterium]